jgi:hypothetical protein
MAPSTTSIFTSAATAPVLPILPTLTILEEDDGQTQCLESGIPGTTQTSTAHCSSSMSESSPPVQAPVASLGNNEVAEVGPLG